MIPRSLRGPGALLPALVFFLGLALAGPAWSATREYWVVAEPVTWNVVPNGHDAIGGMEFTPEETTIRTVVYRAYTPGWKKPLRDVPWKSGDNDGIPGPMIRGRVGDTILVHFLNRDVEFGRPHSMHFHGVEYAFESDGSFIPGFSGEGGNVMPGSSYTYVLRAGKQSKGVWPYHDHSPSMMESIHGGMYGALSILGRNERPPDKEFVVFLSSTAGFSTINGRAFVGNTPVHHARVGDVVQWDVLAIGDEFHTFHVHGHRWLRNGVPEDTRTIGPAESFAVRWREDVPGEWLYHCHVEGHMEHGMIGLYRVSR